MPRARDPNRDKAREIWEASKGKKKLKDIAADLGVSDTQIRKWKSQDKWEQGKGNVTNSKRNVTNVKKSGGQPGNKGNQNPVSKFPKRNKAAEKHGIFSKYLPPETLEIMELVNNRSPADLIWDQIQIQYAAIIRAQHIMFVADKNDMAKERSQVGWGDSGSDKYDIQFAWDRHATFLNAQSRAMSELRGLIKQFDEMAHVHDERRLKLEQMRLNIEKTKADIDKASDDDKPIEIIIKRKSQT
ncbi:phage terminase small subunit [Fictibacillus aquaticus]|uniref:PBSX phage terminase small subunit-like N-terminal domain-containing protein n=1 Tax=Fictibacillus aquaticus TaxID=2021314 RepID=A0A235FC01_9BACL|nr:phage terminase small subunit [Fictibacillus aquaticus]OYD58467.1 hypothetical protein CGZ90_00770 [Fictibacillus aquaticus]